MPVNFDKFNENMKKENLVKIEDIIEEIELEYISSVESNIEKRKKLLPLTKPEQIKALIWNLLSSEKYRKKLSYANFSKILDVWFSRIKK
jgi:hypothetical protein